MKVEEILNEDKKWLNLKHGSYFYDDKEFSADEQAKMRKKLANLKKGIPGRKQAIKDAEAADNGPGMGRGTRQAIDRVKSHLNSDLDEIRGLEFHLKSPEDRKKNVHQKHNARRREVELDADESKLWDRQEKSRKANTYKKNAAERRAGKHGAAHQRRQADRDKYFQDKRKQK